MTVPDFDIGPFLEKKKKKGPPKYPPLEDVLKIVPKIHGHVCTASYLGSRMALLGVKHLDLKRKKDLAAAVEILTCAADGIASATMCSFGSGRLVFLDHGKFSCIFSNWMSRKSVRVSLKPEIDKEHIEFGTELSDFYVKLAERDIEEAMAARKKLNEVENNLIKKWHKMPDDELFIVKEVDVNPEDLKYPLDQQYIPEPIHCEKCNDLTEKLKTMKINGERLCRPCAGKFKIKEI